ncbi:unnamed protein product [Amoebophrya sp. A25]|nr:unnamed protein product [Amoebophrya sp. A25]|eukprot:GSA25T00005369001.1
MSSVQSGYFALMRREFDSSAQDYMSKLPEHNRQPYTMKPFAPDHPETTARSAHVMRQRNTWNAVVGEPAVQKNGPDYTSFGHVEFAKLKQQVPVRGPAQKFEKPMTTQMAYGFVESSPGLPLRGPQHPISSSPMTKYYDNMMKMTGKRGAS